jgi:hypothetical protein
MNRKDLMKKIAIVMISCMVFLLNGCGEPTNIQQIETMSGYSLYTESYHINAEGDGARLILMGTVEEIATVKRDEKSDAMLGLIFMDTKQLGDNIVIRVRDLFNDFWEVRVAYETTAIQRDIKRLEGQDILLFGASFKKGVFIKHALFFDGEEVITEDVEKISEMLAR